MALEQKHVALTTGVIILLEDSKSSLKSQDKPGPQMREVVKKKNKK